MIAPIAPTTTFHIFGVGLGGVTAGASFWRGEFRGQSGVKRCAMFQVFKKKKKCKLFWDVR